MCVMLYALRYHRYALQPAANPCSPSLYLLRSMKNVAISCRQCRSAHHPNNTTSMHPRPQQVHRHVPRHPHSHRTPCEPDFGPPRGGADWTDLELMPPDCALTGGYAPVSGDPPQTAPGLCASDQELPMANKSRQGRFRCLKIQIQVFVTVFWGCLAVP